jgi:hypothetical protein
MPKGGLDLVTFLNSCQQRACLQAIILFGFNNFLFSLCDSLTSLWCSLIIDTKQTPKISLIASVPRRSATYFFKSAVQFKMTLICWRSGVSGNEGTRKRLPLRAGV